MSIQLRMMDNIMHRCFTADSGYYGLLKVFAKENKQYQTPQETILWENLRRNKLGLHFRRQHIIGKYIADFVCLKKMLVVEVDGGYHSQYDQMIKDLWRTENLKEAGFRVIRIKNEDIDNNLSEVLDNIFNNISK